MMQWLHPTILFSCSKGNGYNGLFLIPSHPIKICVLLEDTYAKTSQNMTDYIKANVPCD